MLPEVKSEGYEVRIALLEMAHPRHRVPEPVHSLGMDGRRFDWAWRPTNALKEGGEVLLDPRDGGLMLGDTDCASEAGVETVSAVDSSGFPVDDLGVSLLVCEDIAVIWCGWAAANVFVNVSKFGESARISCAFCKSAIYVGLIPSSIAIRCHVLSIAFSCFGCCVIFDAFITIPNIEDSICHHSMHILLDVPILLHQRFNPLHNLTLIEALRRCHRVVDALHLRRERSMPTLIDALLKVCVLMYHRPVHAIRRGAEVRSCPPAQQC